MKLFHGHCLNFLKEIEDNSVDMVLCDPPFGVTANIWDSPINLDKLWVELKRVTVFDGAICLFATNPFAAKLISSNIEMFKYEWVWLKSNRTDFVRAKLKPMGSHELILVFSQASVANGADVNMRYFPQGLQNCHRVNSNVKAGGKSLWDQRNMGVENKMVVNDSYVQTKTGYPSDRLEFKSDKEKYHPTQKPVRLLKYLIETYTEKGQTVLDFTMGSGSTGVAAIRSERDFIGIEIDSKYFEIAENRCNDAICYANDPNYTLDCIQKELEIIRKPTDIPPYPKVLYARYHWDRFENVPEKHLRLIKKWYNIEIDGIVHGSKKC